MNKDVFILVADRLEAQVTALKWIDLDSGQIDMQAERPPITFPGCLIDIAYPQCEEASRYGQNVTANITLRLVFQPQGDTHNHSTARSTALAAVFDVIDAVHTALQGWGTSALSNLSRINAQPEKRRDGLKVYKVTYQTTFSETTGA